MKKINASKAKNLYLCFVFKFRMNFRKTENKMRNGKLSVLFFSLIISSLPSWGAGSRLISGPDIKGIPAPSMLSSFEQINPDNVPFPTTLAQLKALSLEEKATKEKPWNVLFDSITNQSYLSPSQEITSSSSTEPESSDYWVSRAKLWFVALQEMENLFPLNIVPCAFYEFELSTDSSAKNAMMLFNITHLKK